MSCTHRQSKLTILFVMVVIITIPAGVSTAEHQSNEGVFEVETTETNEPVVEGEGVALTATVTNTGDETDSQQIHLKNSDNEILDSIRDPALTLAPGESTEVRLTWQTEDGDAGTHALRVSSDNDLSSESVTVEQADDTEDESDGEDDTETDSPTTDGPSPIVPMAGGESERSGGVGGNGGYLEHSYVHIEGTVANVTGYDIDSITFAGPSGGFVLLSELRALPDDIEQTEDVVALYDISLSRQAPMPATIEIHMDAAAFDGADTEDIVVRRWNGSAWNDLDTNVTGESTVHIEAETPSFSVFAVTAGNETAVDTVTENQKVDEPESDEQVENETAGETTVENETVGETTVETDQSGESEAEENVTSTNEEAFAATALLTNTDDASVVESQSTQSAEAEQTETQANENSQALRIGLVVVAVLGTLGLVFYRRRTMGATR